MAYSYTQREEESNINKYRVDNNLSWVELQEQTGEAFNRLYRLTTGVTSPLYLTPRGKYNTGDIKPTVISLMSLFNVPFEDLFPRYACKLNTLKLSNTQKSDICHSQNSGSPERKIFKKELWKTLYTKVLKSYAKKRIFFVIRLRMMGYTLEEIGNKMGVTRERVRQLEAKGMRAALKYKKIIKEAT